MDNKERLNDVKILLREINNSWNEEEVESYESNLSFDELVSEFEHIFLK